MSLRSWNVNWISEKHIRVRMCKMCTPQLYRKRYIPFETVHLKNDVIVELTDEVVITKWKTLRPRVDFSYGCSCVFIKDGFKISKFFKTDGELLYFYCDIIETVYCFNENSYTFCDLIVDVIVMPDGFVKVLDLGQLPQALDSGLITYDTLKKTLGILNKLLDIIYSGEFYRLTKHLDSLCFEVEER